MEPKRFPFPDEDTEAARVIEQGLLEQEHEYDDYRPYEDDDDSEGIPF